MYDYYQRRSERNEYDPNEYQPQTQPQRQKDRGWNSWDGMHTKTKDPYEGRLWRDSQRDDRKGPPKPNRMSSETIFQNVNDYMNAADEARRIADAYEDFDARSRLGDKATSIRDNDDELVYKIFKDLGF